MIFILNKLEASKQGTCKRIKNSIHCWRKWANRIWMMISQIDKIFIFYHFFVIKLVISLITMLQSRVCEFGIQIQRKENKSKKKIGVKICVFLWSICVRTTEKISYGAGNVTSLRKKESLNQEVPSHAKIEVKNDYDFLW